MRVMKFGGTSVGDSTAIEQTATILAQAYAEDAGVIAVVSAMTGVTNLLLDSASQASHGQFRRSDELRSSLITRHEAVVKDLIHDPQRAEATLERIQELTERGVRLIESVDVLRDLSPRVKDTIASFGERMSSVLVANVLEDRGVSAASVESDRVIITDDLFGAATPFLGESRDQAEGVIVPLLQQRVLPVVTGFFGSTRSGLTTTLGRGGSDYSAAILANILDADEIFIWTDVDGVLTADPRLVPEARTLGAISFAEATELAYFGAKVIHPRTMQPAADRGIPIWIKNTFNPEHPGTRIGVEPVANGAVKAVTAIQNVSAITVEGSGFLGVASVTARVFSAIGRAGINVFMISQASSRHSLSFIVQGSDGRTAVKVLEREFEIDLERRRLLRIWEDADMAAVAVVGAGMRGTPGVAGRVFRTLGDAGINLVAIAQGSSELNISFVIANHEIGRAVPLLHNAFELAGVLQH